MKLNRSRKLKNIIVLIVLLSIVATPFIYVQVNKWIYADRVKTYLIEQKHYTKDELASVTGRWTIKLPPFMAEVVFADEPNITYMYFAHAEVMQYKYYPTGGRVGDPIGNKPLQHLEK